MRAVANVLKQKAIEDMIMGQETRGEIAKLPALRIIDEDDHHAVIAVRVKKAWLAAHVPFVAALADVATTPTILPIA